MEKIYAYLRVSSKTQELAHQRYEIENYAKRENIIIDEWIEEKISSRKSLGQRKLGELLEKLSEGSVIVTSEVSRLGRSMLDIMEILKISLAKKIKIITLKENYQFSDEIESKVLIFAFSLASEIERSLISQRTKASLANLKAQGKKLGRPFAAESKKLKLSRYAKKVRELLDLGVTQYKIAKILGVHQITIKRFIERMGWA